VRAGRLSFMRTSGDSTNSIISRPHILRGIETIYAHLFLSVFNRTMLEEPVLHYLDYSLDALNSKRAKQQFLREVWASISRYNSEKYLTYVE
jgi:hypothetical protein